MKIYIMRHGEAAHSASADSLRPLTKQGVIEAEKMGQWLTRCRLTLKHVFVSPYLRAQQTCTHTISVLKEVGLLNGVVSETLDFITPSGNARQMHDFIDGLLQSNDGGLYEEYGVVLVSHMPFVSYLVAELTDKITMPIFSTGAIAIIDYDIEKMQGQLVDIISPENQ